MQGVNFLRIYQEKIRQRAQRIFYLQLSAFSLLVIYGLVVVGTFAYFFILGSEGKILDDKINFQKKRIEEAVATETKQVYLKSKLTNLANVLESSRNHQLVVEGVFSLLPEGVEVQGFSLSEKGEVSFQGRASSFQSLKNLFENIEKGQLAGKLPIYKAVVTQVSLDEKGGFNFGMVLNISALEEL